VAARLGIPVALGTDSQAQIDLLEDTRQTEVITATAEAGARDFGCDQQHRHCPRLFDSATRAGYRALGIEAAVSQWVSQPTFSRQTSTTWPFSAWDRASLVAQAVFALGRSAIRDVAVAGHLVIENGVQCAGQRDSFAVIARSKKDLPMRGQ